MSLLTRPRASLRTVMTFAPLLLGVATFDCASGGDGSQGSPSDISSGGKEPRPSGIMNILGSSDASGGNGAKIDPLCGIGTCVPDGEASCDGDGQGGAGFGGASNLGGASLGGSMGGAHASGSSCKLDVTPYCKEDCVKRACSETGGRGRSEVCSKASDCAEGLGCVGEGPVGTCQPYCCLGSENSCEKGDFCDIQPAVGDQLAKLPVCSPIGGCSLLEPVPCPADVACQCTKDRACLIVRGDGRTSCAIPGTGVQGDTCAGVDSRECAAGFVCSTSLGCLKICSTKKQDADCATGTTCQSTDFSTELGVCVPSSSGTEITR